MGKSKRILKDTKTIHFDKAHTERQKTEYAGQMNTAELTYYVQIIPCDNSPQITFGMGIPVQEFGMNMHMTSCHYEEVYRQRLLPLHPYSGCDTTPLFSHGVQGLLYKAIIQKPEIRLDEQIMRESPHGSRGLIACTNETARPVDVPFIILHRHIMGILPDILCSRITRRLSVMSYENSIAAGCPAGLNKMYQSLRIPDTRERPDDDGNMRVLHMYASSQRGVPIFFKYQSTVLTMPLSKFSSGCQPSSVTILVGSMA